MRTTFLLLTFLAGVGLGLQPAINGRLRDAVSSPALAAVVSFVVGLALLVVVTAAGLWGGTGTGVAGLRSAPPWVYVGGAIGAFYVLLAPIALQRIGAASLICAAVFGQQAVALLLDTTGWLGVPKTPLTPTRVAGAVLLLAGVVLLQRKG